jgi:uncharacterized protein (DUF4415 family)
MAVIHGCSPLSDRSNTVELSIKERIIILLSREMVDAFRATGSGCQTNKNIFEEAKRSSL